jgi:hypothetical protein
MRGDWSQRGLWRVGDTCFLECDPRQTGRVVARLTGERPVRVVWDATGWKSDVKASEIGEST